MKSLHTIQTLAKVGKVLSKIVFIFCIIGMVGCMIGVLSLALVGGEALVISGVPITSTIEKEAELSMGMIYASVIAGIFACIGEAVLAKFAEVYFKKELVAGTPFTFEGAKELLRLGILTICIPLGIGLMEAIVYGVASIFTSEMETMNYSNEVSISLGITFIILSVIFNYGAELTENRSESAE